MEDAAIVARPRGLSHSPELGELAAALAKAQAAIKGAVKDSDNPFFKSKYADLASVWDACRKQLTDNELAVVQAPVMNGSLGVTTMLLHSSGQWIAAHLSAMPKDQGPQAIGSVISYLRRYSLAAFAGVPQIDDDAEGAEGRHEAPGKRDITTGQPKPSAGGSTISEAQGKRLWAISKAHGWTLDEVRALLVSCGLEHTKDIKAADYDDLIAKLQERPKVGA